MQAVVCPTAPAAPPESIDAEFRLVWGADDAERFSGSIVIDHGSIQLVRNLCMDPESTGCIQARSSQQIDILPGTRTSFGGFDLNVAANTDAELTLSMTVGGGVEPSVLKVSLSDLLSGSWVEPVGESKMRVAIERQAHDRIRFKSKHPSHILNVQQEWSAEVSGYRTGLPVGKYRLDIQIVDRSGRVLSSQDQWLELDDTGSFAPRGLSIQTPATEGAYLLELTLRRERFMQSLVSSPVLLSRRIDFVVLATNARHEQIGQWQTLANIDPLKASQSGSLAWLVAPDFGFGDSLTAASDMSDAIKQYNPLAESMSKPLSSGDLGSRKLIGIDAAEPLDCLQIEPGGWLAIPLGLPADFAAHRIRVEVPTDLPMHLAVSLRQRDSNGSFSSLNPDSSIEIDRRGAASGLATHDLIFWPTHVEQYLVLANASETDAASVSSLKVERAQLAQPALPQHPSPRMVGVYLDKPLLTQAFSASRQSDHLSGRLLDSWQTRQEATSRLMQYLDWVGANTVFINVYTDGGAIFPSQQLQPSPRFDSGVFFSDGRSPDIKDATELLLRHADREAKHVVLSLNFNAPLAKLRYSDSTKPEAAEGLLQKPIDGSQSAKHTSASVANALRFNPLASELQSQVVAMVREIVARYGHHRSLAGIALQLDQDSQLLFAGDRWGYDRQLLNRFALAAGAKLPTGQSVAQIFAQRPLRQAYLEWRADELTKLYESILLEIRRSNPDRKLYLNATRLWQHAPHERDFFDPEAIVRTPNQLLLAYGLNASSVARIEGVELMRGSVQERSTSVSSRDWIRQLASRYALQDIAAENKSSAVVFQSIQPLALASATAESPPMRPLSQAAVYAQSSQAGRRAVKEIIGQLYESDALLLVEGGWSPRFGQEEIIRTVYGPLRSLPPRVLEPVQGLGTDSNIRIRQGIHQETLYIQVINNAPWGEQLRLQVSARGAPSLQALGTSTQPPQIGIREQGGAGGFQFDLPLEPYSLKCLKIDDPTASLIQVDHLARKPDGEQVVEQLEQMEALLAQSTDPTQQKLLANIEGTFESWVEPDKATGWSFSSLPQVEIVQSKQFPHTGQYCVSIENRARSNVSAWVQSREFSPPQTGRLTVEAWLRAPATSPPLLVRLSLLGRTQAGERFERSSLHGGLSRNGSRIPIDWGSSPLKMSVGDIPIEEIEALSVAVDLIGPGKVWVDDVRVLETRLQQEERIYLRGQLLVAKQRLLEGNPFPAEQLLDSQWGRYLAAFGTASRPFRVPAARVPNDDDRQSYDSASRWNSTAPLFQQWRDTIRDRWQR